MIKLSDCFTTYERNGSFTQTQFANTTAPNSLCYAEKQIYVAQLNKNSNISCVITKKNLGSMVSEQKGLVVDDNPAQLFYELHNELYRSLKMKVDMPYGRGRNSQCHPSAIISEKSYIGSNVKIGAGVIIEESSYIDDDVQVESGAIIGSPGHYYKNFDNQIFRVEHAGGVKLCSRAQILSGAIISKSLHTDFTVIGSDSVISVNAHIGHGCKVGKRCIVAGGAQVSGYTNIGENTWIGPSATLGNLITIGRHCKIEIGAVVIKDLEDFSHVSGNFAQRHSKNIKSYAKSLSKND